MTFTLDIVTPEKILDSGSAEMVVVPGSEGDFGVMAGHSPVISSVRPGVIRVYEGGKVVKRFLISGGLAEVNQEKVTILATEAHDFKKISKEDLEKRLFEIRRIHEKSQAANKPEELDVLEGIFTAFVAEVDEANHAH